VLGDIGRADREVGATTRAAEAADRDAARLRCAGQSFRPDTLVVMADGSTKRIDKVVVGDKVRATNPTTGKTTTRTVTYVWVNHDTDLMDVVVRSGGAVSVVHATRHHPIWDQTQHAWTDAQDLRPGDHLTTGNLALAAVVAVVEFPARPRCGTSPSTQTTTSTSPPQPHYSYTTALTGPLSRTGPCPGRKWRAAT
jgi:hypothetical protein